MTAPKQWEIFPLNALVEVLDNLRVPVNSSERSKRPGSVPYYGATGQVGTIDKAIFDEELIVLGEDGVQFFDQNKPKAYKISGPAWVNNHAHVLRPKTDKVLQNFLLHFLNQFNYVGYANGTTRLKLTQGAMNSIPVPLPTLAEQHKIVELLEDHLAHLDAAVADIKQAKIKANQLRQSLLQDAMTGNLGRTKGNYISKLPKGWESKRLIDCLEKLKSGKMAERGWSPQCLSHPSPNENVWGVLKTTSVQMGEFLPEYNKELPESLVVKSGLEVSPGDFLVTTTGPRNRCGIVCYVKNTRKKLIFSGKILRFRVNEDLISPNWLMFLLMSSEYQGTLDKMKVGSSDSSVSIGNQQFLDLEIVVPPISEQHRIVELLDGLLSQIDISVSIAKSMENQAVTLRRSLLQAAFTGQLTNEVLSV